MSEEYVRISETRKNIISQMGAHGHKGLQDLVFGTTIEGVRHELDAPIMIVRAPRH